MSDQPPSGAMTTPPTAATDSAELSTPFETSPIPRVADTLDQLMAQALSNPAPSTVPDSREAHAADAPPSGSATTAVPDADMLGEPHGPTATRGLTDGSCCELTPPTERTPDSAPPSESARWRASDPDVMQTTPLR